MKPVQTTTAPARTSSVPPAPSTVTVKSPASPLRAVTRAFVRTSARSRSCSAAIIPSIASSASSKYGVSAA